MSNQHLVVLCTAPDRDTAMMLAETAVNERLAACVSVIPGITSVYEWQGKAETDTELQLIIKTSQASYARLQQRLLELHPYELPEIIAVPVTEGLAGYLSWINETTGVTE